MHMSDRYPHRRAVLGALAATLGSTAIGTVSGSSPETNNHNQPAFSDVPPSNLYYEAIQYLGTNSPDHRGGVYLSGYPDGTFRPFDKVSRAEFAAVYDSAFDIQASQEEIDDVYFKDMEDISGQGRDHWAKEPVYRLAAAGIIAGVGNERFAPDQTVTREQALHMLTLFDHPGESDHSQQRRDWALAYFRDNTTISNWARPRVGEAAARGYVNPGFPARDDTASLIEPQFGCNRGLVAVYLYRKLGFHMSDDDRDFPPEDGSDVPDFPWN
jgi:hypothetical protein